ncbi:MAG: restriction endonuclease subunit S [Corynebacterium sp.]|nr:restriction endonuclease subunit S [Corynebacterium sp.]
MNEGMKDTGIEQIGSVPQKWERWRLKDIASLAGRIGWQGLTSEEYKDEGPYLITGVDFSNGDINWDSCVHIEHKRWLEATDVRINNGDLLITKDGTVGKVAMCSELDGLASLNSGIMVVRPKISWNKRFMYWLLQSEVFWGWFNDINAGNSTITHLYQGDFYNFFFFLPSSLKTQEAIANELDVLIKKMDRATSRLQQQIKALEAYKKSLIHEAVTKGLDSSVPMKDSGIDYVGMIPRKWTITFLKYVASITRGGSPRPINDYLTFGSDGYNWLKIGDTSKSSKFVNSTEEKIIRAGLSATRLVRSGALLLTNSMSFGEAYISTIDVCIHDGWLALEPNNLIDKNFLYYALKTQSILFQFRNAASGGVVQNLNIQKAGKCAIALPSIGEQQQIAAYLDERCKALDRALELKREQLELLKQQRQSLIFEYVTGKRRVGQEW